MAKQIFKGTDVNLLGKAQLIDSPHIQTEERMKKEEEILPKEKTEEEKLKSLEEIELEFEHKQLELEQQIAEEKQAMVEESHKIKKDAESWAFKKIQEASQEYDRRIKDAEDKARSIRQEAEFQIQEIQKDVQDKASEMEQSAYNKGYEDGREDGFNSGREEVDRLIERLNIILQSSLAKRDEVIEEAEAQVIEIIMAICRKVVKSVTEAQKNVVIDNIHKALDNIRQRSEITIKVNTEDLQMTTKHKREFIASIEDKMKAEGRDVKILEDNTIERGGALIETDFGSIDARIRSQLAELEAKIKELSPYQEQF